MDVKSLWSIRNLVESALLLCQNHSKSWFYYICWISVFCQNNLNFFLEANGGMISWVDPQPPKNYVGWIEGFWVDLQGIAETKKKISMGGGDFDDL